MLYIHLGTNMGPNIGRYAMQAKITSQFVKNLKATGKGYEVNDTEMPGFSLRVSAEGKPTSYSVRYRATNGRRQRMKVGSAKVLSPRHARDLAQQSLADVTKGEDPQDIRKRLRGIKTLGSFIEEDYAPHELAHQKSGEATLKRLKACFSEYWNRPIVDRAWNATILTWRNKRIENGRILRLGARLPRMEGLVISR